MNASLFRFALGFGGALAVAGCSSSTESGSEADTLAQQMASCLTGRAFYFASNVNAPAARMKVGTIVADTPDLAQAGGDAGQIEATVPLDYRVDAAGRTALAAQHVCAPGVRCFPSSATAEFFPRDRGGFTFDLSLVDTFGPYRGGRVLALAPADLHGSTEESCPK